VVRFSVPPLPMLRALADGKLLEEPEIEITGEGPIRLAGADPQAASQTFPFH
jgi:hypothetical protein